MANQDSGYFGMKLGEALSAGAGHIANALQRKYELQRQEELRQQQEAKAQAMQQQTLRMGFAQKGIAYDPNNPEASFGALQKQGVESSQLGQMKTLAEIQKLQAEAGKAGQSTPPPGFRTTATGLEPIPGGPAALKIEAEQAQKAEDTMRTEAARAGQMTTASETMNAINKAEELSNKMFSTGWSGLITKALPNTDARALDNQLNTIKANVGFDRLTKMRNESKTGGALGQVSERELALLSSSAAPLDPQDKYFKENLEEVKKHYARFVTSLKDFSGYSKSQLASELMQNGFDRNEAIDLAADYFIRQGGQ